MWPPDAPYPTPHIIIIIQRVHPDHRAAPNGRPTLRPANPRGVAAVALGGHHSPAAFHSREGSSPRPSGLSD